MNPVGSEAAKHAKDVARQQFDKGLFSYSCLRGAGHLNCGACIECTMRGLMRSKEVVEQFSQISGISLVGLFKDFFVEFQEGDFISPHTDEINGRLGFVLQLSQGWQASHGGLLHFTQGERGQLLETIVPTFNTLTLFDTASRDIWHHVSVVEAGGQPRISMSGWYR